MITADDSVRAPCEHLASLLPAAFIVAGTIEDALTLAADCVLWHTSVEHSEANYEQLHERFPCLIGLTPKGPNHDKMGGKSEKDDWKGYNFLDYIFVPFDDELAQIIIHGTYKRIYG